MRVRDRAEGGSVRAEALLPRGVTMRGAARYGTVFTLLVLTTLLVLLLPQPGETLSEPGRKPEPRPRAMSVEPIVTLSPSIKDANQSFTITATASSAFFVDGDTDFILDAQDDPDDVSVSNVTVVSSTSLTASVTTAQGASDQWVTMKCRASSSMIIQRAAFRIDGTDTSAKVSFSDVINLAPTGSQVSITLYSPDAAFASDDVITTDNAFITIDDTTYDDSSHWDVDLTVATWATLGDVKVSITNGGTVQSLAYLYIVDETPAETKLIPNGGKVQEGYRARDAYISQPSIFAHNGEYITSQTDLVIKGRGFDFVWTRTSRSQVMYMGPYGANWTTNYNLYVDEDESGDVYFYDGTGRKDLYTEDSGVYTSPAGHYTEMEKVSGVFFITDSHGMEYEFDGPNGRLSKIEDRNGNKMDFYYDSAGYLEEVVDTLGRSIFFYYTTAGYLEFIDDFALRTVTYVYDGYGALTSATSPAVDVSINNDYPNGKKTEYTYSVSLVAYLNNNLLTIKRPREVADAGSAYLSNTYITTGDDVDKLDKQTLRGKEWDVTYDTQNAKTTVKDPALNEAEYYYRATYGDLSKIREKTRSLRPGEPSYYETEFTHNSETEVTEVEFPVGNKKQWTYDHTNSDHKKRGNLTTYKRVSDTPLEEPDQTTTYTYTSTYNMVDTVTDPLSQVTDHDYDSYGNRTKTTHPTVTSGQPASQSIVEEWTYNSYGQVTQYTDPEGNDTDHTYFTTGSSTGYLKDVTVDSGTGNENLKTEFETDSLGYRTKVTDPEGNVRTYEVNELGELVLVTRPKPSGWTNAPQIRIYYDENGMVEKREIRNLDETGAARTDEWIVTEHTYDAMNNRTKVKQEVSSGAYVETNFTYTDNNLVAQITYPEGDKVNHQYDERRLLWILSRGYASADNATYQIDYDDNANAEYEFGGEPPPNALYTYEYNGFDQWTKRTDVLGHYTKRTYKNCCDLVETEEHFDSANNSLAKAKYYYDEVRRVYKVERTAKDSDGSNIGDGYQTTEFLNDKNSRLTEVKDDNGNKTTHTYDGANRRTKTVDDLGESVGNYIVYTLDDNGNVAKTESKQYNQKTSTLETLRTDYTFDALDRRTKVTVDPTGKNLISELWYDSLGKLVKQEDPEDVVTKRTYDYRGLRTKTTYDPTGLNTVLDTSWDDNGRLEWREDGNNNKTQCAYDDRWNLKTITYADSETKTFTYSKDDVRKTVTDSNGTVVTNTLNDLGWVTSVSISRGTGVLGVDSVTNAFDGLGRLTSSTLKESTTQISKVEYDYDTLSRADEERQVVGSLASRTIARTYDALGRKTQIGYPTSRTIDLVYDDVNRLDQVKESTTVLGDYQFAGRRTAQLDLDNDTRLKVTFDTARRATDWDWEKKNAQQQWVVMAGFDYAWNKNGTREFEDRTHDSKGDAYKYDNLDMLTGVKYGETNLSAGTAYSSYSSYDSKEEPTYDAVGNRKTVGNGTTVKYNHVSDVYTADNMNEYYDIDGTSRTHDDNGNLTDDGTYECDYDYRDRLVKVTNTTPNPDEVIAEYTYDHKNRRIKKVVTNSGSLNGTTVFFYDGWRVIEEQDGSGNKAAQYVYGRGIDAVVQMQRDVEGDSGFETYYYHANSMGSVEMLTDDTDNDVVEEYDFKAFGDFTTPQSLSGLDNPYHFQGRRYDAETGFYYFRNRYNDPSTGRFLQRDPRGLWADSMNIGNAYSFAGNNAANYSDPFGLEGGLTDGDAGVCVGREWEDSHDDTGTGGKGICSMLFDICKQHLENLDAIYEEWCKDWCKAQGCGYQFERVPGSTVNWCIYNMKTKTYRAGCGAKWKCTCTKADGNDTDGTTDGNDNGDGTNDGNDTGDGTNDGNDTGDGTNNGNNTGNGTTDGNNTGNGPTGGNNSVGSNSATSGNSIGTGGACGLNPPGTPNAWETSAVSGLSPTRCYSGSCAQ